MSTVIRKRKVSHFNDKQCFEMVVSVTPVKPKGKGFVDRRISGKNNLFAQMEPQLQFSPTGFLLLLMIIHTGQTHLDSKRPRNYMAAMSGKDKSYLLNNQIQNQRDTMNMKPFMLFYCHCSGRTRI